MSVWPVWGGVVRPRLARCVVVLVISCGVLAGCGSDAAAGSVVTKATDTGELVIGTRFNQPGLSERTLDGRYVGFDIDVARFVAAELGVDAEDIVWRDVLAEDREDALASGRLDLVVSTYSITEERKKKVRFAGPYFITGQSIMVRAAEKGIRAPAHLNGKRLCSVVGTTSAKHVKERFAQRVELKEYPRDPDCVIALLAGNIDAVTTDELILAGYVAEHPELLKVVGKQFETEEYGIGLARDDLDGQRAVNAALQEMVDSGEWLASARRHFGSAGIRIPDPPPITER